MNDSDPNVTRASERTADGIPSFLMVARRDRQLGLDRTFHKLQHDGELSISDIMTALRIVGIKGEKEWIDDILLGYSYSTMSLGEWGDFMRNYEDKIRAAYTEQFCISDADSSGTLDVSELESLLESVGITPFPWVLEEVLTDCALESSKLFTCDEFQLVIELLSVREGFSTAELDELKTAFLRHDKDDSGEINAVELVAVFGWLGFPQQMQIADTLVSEIDVDDSGTLAWTEYLVCMRRFREIQVQKVKELIQENDQDGSGMVDRDELFSMLGKLGYTVNVQAIAEFCAEAGMIHENGNIRDGFNFVDMWTLLRVIRKKAGFTNAEEKELARAFKRFEEKGGGVSTLQLGKVLRNLGVPIPVDRLGVLVQAVDVDNSGQIDIHEFKTLMRQNREVEMKQIKAAFSLRSGGKDYLSAKDGDLRRALSDIDCIDPSNAARRNGQEPDVNFDEFVRLCDKHRQEARDRMRRNAGFTDAEVEEWREKFHCFDASSAGEIGGRQLRGLIESLLPDLCGQRAKLEKLLKEVDEDGNGTLNFQDFLRLMRHRCDDREKEELDRIEGAIADSKFTQEEAKQFRVLFDAEDPARTGRLSLPIIQRMLERFCRLGRKHIEDLTALVQKSTDGGTTSIDYPSFLRVMRAILDSDLANVNDAAKREALEAARYPLERGRSLEGF